MVESSAPPTLNDTEPNGDQITPPIAEEEKQPQPWLHKSNQDLACFQIAKM